MTNARRLPTTLWLAAALALAACGDVAGEAPLDPAIPPLGAGKAEGGDSEQVPVRYLGREALICGYELRLRIEPGQWYAIDLRNPIDDLPAAGVELSLLAKYVRLPDPANLPHPMADEFLDLPGVPAAMLPAYGGMVVEVGRFAAREPGEYGSIDLWGEGTAFLTGRHTRQAVEVSEAAIWAQGGSGRLEQNPEALRVYFYVDRRADYAGSAALALACPAARR